MSARAPSLAAQGRQLAELERRILAVHEATEARVIEDAKHAAAWRAQAEAETAPLIAEGATLRDAIVLRARRRAQRSWWVVYAGCALIATLLVGWWLRGWESIL